MGEGWADSPKMRVMRSYCPLVLIYHLSLGNLLVLRPCICSSQCLSCSYHTGFRAEPEKGGRHGGALVECVVAPASYWP